ncbi:glycosyltransferase [Reinekea forsetii]|nr:glycosyltransferase [Reinekea forsetii]
MTKKALFIAKNWPEPNSTAAGRRTLDVLQIIEEMGFSIHIACTAEATPFQADFDQLGYATHAIDVNCSSFDQWVAKLQPALVIYDRFVMEEQFGWRVREQVPNALTLLDTSDLHCLRIAREKAFKHNKAINLFNETAVREISAISRCDFTLMISKAEIDILKTEFNIPSFKCLYLPFLVSKLPKPSQIRFKDRQHLVMIGGFKHEPNRDATRWLREALWPAIRPLLPNGTEMHVFGAYADHAMNQLNAPKVGFFVKGRTESSLKTVEQYRLNLAPIRFGAGQKGKILEGWLTGTPTLTTPIGAESMLGDQPNIYELSDKPELFAKQVAHYYLNEGQWQELQSDGYQRIAKDFLKESQIGAFTSTLENALTNVANHRSQDFWQQLMWQNQLGAMKYMSRWIEAKNKPD